MARSHAKLLTSIWSDPDWLALSAPAQHCYKLLLSQKKVTLAGLLPYTPSRWARLSRGNTLASVEAAIHELEASASRFVVVDRETDELLIRTFVRHDITNLLSNSNLVKGFWRAWEAIESRQLRHEVIPNIPASVWDYRNVTPPAQAQALRGQPPPNAQVTPNETDRSNQPFKPAVQTSLSPPPSSLVTSPAAREAPLESAPANEAAAVDNSNVRLTDEERTQVYEAAIEVLVARELERNPSYGNPKRHADAVRNGKLGDYHAAGHHALFADPSLTPEQLAKKLEPTPKLAAPSDPLSAYQRAQQQQAEAGARHVREVLDEELDIEQNLSKIHEIRNRQLQHHPPEAS